MNILPLYWIAKMIFLLYLSLPQTRGAHILYLEVVEPFFIQLEKIFNGKIFLFKQLSNL